MSKYTVKLTQSSKYSYTITIPKEILKKYGWREKQKLTVEDKGQGHLVVRDWKKR